MGCQKLDTDFSHVLEIIHSEKRHYAEKKCVNGFYAERRRSNPFGLQHKGYNNVVNGSENKYQTFQGQEKEEELGKNTYAYQWRDYDPAIARFNKIDRFAEKYYDHSPYHFTANNPIRFAEKGGDSIFIYSKQDKSFVLYENGNLYSKNRKNGNWETYKGKNLKTDKNGNTSIKGFLGKAVSALDEIRNGGQAGSELVGDLQDASNYIRISKGSNSSGGTSGSVSWDPSDTSGGPNQNGKSNRPEYVGLAHELGHAHDGLDGVMDNSIIGNINGKDILANEYYAMHWENRVRSENGISLRTHYSTDGNGKIIGQALNGNTSLHFTKKQVTPTVIQFQVSGSSISNTFKIVPVSSTTTILSPYQY